MLRRLLKCSAVAVIASVFCATDAVAVDPNAPAADAPHVDSVTIHKASGSHHKAHFDGQHLTMQGMSLSWLIGLAYGLPEGAEVDGPDWVHSNGYDIDATVSGLAPGFRVPAPGETSTQPALVALLHDYFQMSAHTEQKPGSGLALTVARGGAKLKPASGSASGISMGVNMGTLVGHSATMAMLASQLWEAAGANVFDETGLKGQYDFTLSFFFNSLGNEKCRPYAIPGECVPTSGPPPLKQALEGELGLTLKPIQHTVTVIVIDHIEKPAMP